MRRGAGTGALQFGASSDSAVLASMPVQGTSLWLWLKAALLRRRNQVEFERFQTFVLAFSTLEPRRLHPDESQAMADDAVRLRLLEVNPLFWTPITRPSFYAVAPGYRRRRASFVFREWLALRERRMATQRISR